MTRVLDSLRAEVACALCGSKRIVFRGEDGDAALETTPCHVEGCKSRMCGECLTRCFGCYQPTCPTHMTDFEGDRWCACCVAAIVAEGAELLTESAS